MSQIKGKISQIIGPVVDVSFENAEKLPNLMDAIEISKDDGTRVVLECQKHIGEDSVRTVAMDSTDGLTRGMDAVAIVRIYTLGPCAVLYLTIYLESYLESCLGSNLESNPEPGLWTPPFPQFKTFRPPAGGLAP